MKKWLLVALMFFLGACINAKPLFYEVDAEFMASGKLAIFNMANVKINGVIDFDTTQKDLLRYFGEPEKISLVEEPDFACGFPRGNEALFGEGKNDYYDYGKTRFIVNEKGGATLVAIDFSTGKFFLEGSKGYVLDYNVSSSELIKFFPSFSINSFPSQIWGCPECDGEAWNFYFDKKRHLDKIDVWIAC